MSNDKIIIEAPNDTTLTIKGGNLVSIKAKDEIRDEKILVEMFNNHYINIVEKSSGSAPKSIGNPHLIQTMIIEQCKTSFNATKIIQV